MSGPMPHLRDVLYSARLGHGLSLQQAATAAGLSKSHIYDIESGKAVTLTVETLDKISRAYGATGWEFLKEAYIRVGQARQTKGRKGAAQEPRAEEGPVPADRVRGPGPDAGQNDAGRGD